ncbi:MAG: ABC transporter permease [Nanoarchaeota archaeon]|nr:ABC transporter permease [Nanoarchaeota archaeon]
MKEYLILGSKNLKRRGIRSWLTLLGVLIGIAAVVSLISLGNTLKDTVNSQFNIASVETISVQAGGITGYGPPGTGVSKPLTKQDSDAIEKLSSVEHAIPQNIRTLRAEYNNVLSFLSATSLPDNEKIRDVYEINNLDISSGRLMERDERNVILIGENIANKDKNPFDRQIEVGNKIKLNDREFRVIGIIEAKGSFIIDNTLYVNQNTLEELTGSGDNVDLISVVPKDKDSIDRAKEDIEKLLRQRRNVKIGDEDFEVSTLEAQLSSVNQILFGIQAFIVIIALISIFVGAIGIANTMATSVLERKKEIGIMKSIGARNKDIFYQFFVEAGLLGLVGGILGIVLGISISYLGTFGINNLLGTETKPNISILLIVLSLTGSFLIGAISGIFPAMKAANQNPVEAIRNE